MKVQYSVALGLLALTAKAQAVNDDQAVDLLKTEECLGG